MKIDEGRRPGRRKGKHVYSLEIRGRKTNQDTYLA